MQVLHHPESGLVPPSGTAVTIGAYDGVHRGHRAVIARVRELAEARGLRSALVTFDRHPASVVRPDSAPKLLCDLPQRLELLADTGLDYTLVVHFDEVRAKEPPEDFVREVLVGALGARAVVVGADFHFGHRRLGNVALLERMGAVHDFEVVGLELVGVDGLPATRQLDGLPATRQADAEVSSTAIRLALTDGDLARATEMLGRAHEVRGPVVRGDGRARELGFRTANVAVPTDICLPADGIYAGWYLRPDGVARPAALSLGRRPTFYEHADTSLLEAHLLDFDDDLYDEAARVRFVSRLRPEEKFDSVDALVAQMGRDCDEARAVLRRLPPGDGLAR
jgi:riboflavin kinase / FMN adenylyltransferase